MGFSNCQLLIIDVPLAAGTEYVFSFQITNPSAAQNASRVYIAASGFVSAEMTTDTADLHGVTDGGSAETAAYDASLM